MIELVQYHTLRDDECCKRVALVKEGRKWLFVLALTAGRGGMSLWKVEKSERRFMKPLMRNNKPYPMSRALKSFRKMVRTHGATKGAKKLIREAAA